MGHKNPKHNIHSHKHTERDRKLLIDFSCLTFYDENTLRFIFLPIYQVSVFEYSPLLFLLTPTQNPAIWKHFAHLNSFNRMSEKKKTILIEKSVWISKYETVFIDCTRNTEVNYTIEKSELSLW